MDRVSKQRRSANMRAVKGRDTKPELAVRQLVHRMGYRFRLNRADLPGKPDLVFPGRRAVIFVHGCFWHAHSCKRGLSTPKTHATFWAKKRAQNVKRDTANLVSLRKMTWQALTVWECELRNARRLRSKIRRFLG